jgi:hypothetical protein
MDSCGGGIPVQDGFVCGRGAQLRAERRSETFSLWHACRVPYLTHSGSSTAPLRHSRILNSPARLRAANLRYRDKRRNASFGVATATPRVTSVGGVQIMYARRIVKKDASLETASVTSHNFKSQPAAPPHIPHAATPTVSSQHEQSRVASPASAHCAIAVCEIAAQIKTRWLLCRLHRPLLRPDTLAPRNCNRGPRRHDPSSRSGALLMGKKKSREFFADRSMSHTVSGDRSLRWNQHC